MAWLLPCGLIMLLVAATGYAWLLVNVLVSNPLVCDFQTYHSLALGEVTAIGVACLAASAFDHPIGQAIAAALAGAISMIGGSLVAIWWYSSQCVTLRMYLHQLF